MPKHVARQPRTRSAPLEGRVGPCPALGSLDAAHPMVACIRRLREIHASAFVQTWDESISLSTVTCKDPRVPRRFVIIGQKAIASDAFLLDDLPGTSGRLDILVRCLRPALLSSHGLRRDVVVYLVLL